MTVTAAEFALTTPMPGWADVQGLPSGIWSADISLTGDASGGLRSISILFASTGQSNPRFYSLEYFNFVDTQNSTENMSIFTSGMGSRQSGGPGFVGMNIVTNTGQTVARSSPEETLAFKGLFLGRQSARNAPALLGIDGDNFDTDVLRVGVAGYVWDSQAMGVSGGIKRPPGPWPA